LLINLQCVHLMCVCHKGEVTAAVYPNLVINMEKGGGVTPQVLGGNTTSHHSVCAVTSTYTISGADRQVATEVLPKHWSPDDPEEI
jgi:hypothetical protein